MADYCNQCAKDLGFPEGDLKPPNSEEFEKEAKFADLCEGCGYIVVDIDGNCLHLGCHSTEDNCKLGG